VDGRLTNSERDKIAKLYNDRYEMHGRDVRTVGWGSTSDQLLRFENLFRGLNPTGKIILDLGCGLGDLVGYLHDCTKGNFRYIGIDLSEKLIEDSRRKWQGDNIEFRVGDIFDYADSKQPDIAVQSGALTLKIDNNETYARQVINKMFSLSTEAACLNFLSTYVDFQFEKNYHYSPEAMFSYAKSLTRWVNLHHDYPLWEFTLQLRKSANV
jgi:SAM-dependent methyltransferase